MPKVSVIIPCYNQGQYIDEAVDSVLKQTYQDFEIIIINDGSTDEYTNKILKDYNKPKTKVIHTTNQGLASARNNGIKEANGEYILPLDADDKIGKEYLEEAIKIFDKISNVGIVYCKAELFEEVKGIWELPKYSLQQILLRNVIFCSAFFKKIDWEKVGGYNPNILYVWQDWDFWLSIIELEREVYRIDKILFYYRIRKSSMARTMTEEQKIDMYYQLYLNHKKLYDINMKYLFTSYVKLLDAESELHRIKKSRRYTESRVKFLIKSS